MQATRHIPSSAARIRESTSDPVQARIDRHTHERIAYYARNTNEIEWRLRELDEEWDTERVLQANAAGLALFGTVAGVFDRKWTLLPLAVTGFLLQHAVQGWCPPLAVIRRLGVRTAREIEAERYALKAVRGDFRGVERSMEAPRRAADATGRLSRAADSREGASA